LTSPHKNINQLVGFLEYSNRDAPEGTKKKIKEVTYAVGAEYSYQDSFAPRLGYFHESPQKEQEDSSL
jgi:hypothetical protein